MAEASVEPGSPEWYLARLIRKIGDKQQKQKKLLNYAIGKHPVPDGDTRYVQALADLQEKAQTNYVTLVLKAVTQRMRVREFKFRGEVDEDAGRFWKANSMELQAAIAIADAARFGETYALISPPEEDDDSPVITVEDPRNCAVELDPIRRTRARAGLKFYADDLEDAVMAVLYLPDIIAIYRGPKPHNDIDYAKLSDRIMSSGASEAGFELEDVYDNELGAVPLVQGLWQPDSGLAECEDGAFNIQDRINHTMLARLIITKAQAYRQRMVAGVEVEDEDGNIHQPWDPGADMLWVTENPQARVWDLDQAEIKDLLEAIRDDIGDLAALTQTPVTYLTNRMVNVSGSAMAAAQHSHVAKVRSRMDSMGWFFEHVIKLCFQYNNDSRWKEPDAETQWEDPEVRTLAEYAEVAAKFAAAEIPVDLVMERIGFTADEIKRAKAEIEKRRREDHEHEVEVKEAGSFDGFGNGGGSNGGSTSNTNQGSGNGAS